MPVRLVLSAALLLVAFAAPADAHLLDAAHEHAMSGFLHPFSGLDHVLAMVAVGLWAAQLGRPATWLLPATFPLVMAAGAAAGAAGLPVPMVEAGIAASVLVLGLLIATMARPSLAIGTALVAAFAFFHGVAHGVELPAAASPAGYGLGFVAATLVLHLAGLGLGRIAQGPARDMMLRFAGSAIAAAGIALLVA